MIKRVLSPVSSSLKTTKYHQKANFTRLISGFSGSARHSNILFNYICVYVTHNIYICIYIYILLRQNRFHLTFLAVYQFLVHEIGKKSYKIHSGIEKTTPCFLSQLRTVFNFTLHRVVCPIFKNLKHPSSVLQKSNSHLVFGGNN